MIFDFIHIKIHYSVLSIGCCEYDVGSIQLSIAIDLLGSSCGNLGFYCWSAESFNLGFLFFLLKWVVKKWLNHISVGMTGSIEKRLDLVSIGLNFVLKLNIPVFLRKFEKLSSSLYVDSTAMLGESQRFIDHRPTPWHQSPSSPSSKLHGTLWHLLHLSLSLIYCDHT